MTKPITASYGVWAGLFLLCSFPVAAATEAVTGPSPFVSLLQVILGLAVVLAAIVGVAWLFRRLSGGVLGVSNRLKVVSGIMVGQRERVVIVELEGEWLVLGVTPQNVNLLHKLQKPEGVDDTAEPRQEAFARLLKAAMQKGRFPLGPTNKS